MDKRKQILESIYGDGREETRLIRTRHGQLEYFTTMTCIERYAPNPCLTLELGAGTGAYSLALAQRGYSVTALELVDKNVQILREKAKDVPNLKVVQGDALDLRDFADDTFDLTLCLGPMYHIYGKGGMDRVLDEAVRVTKPWGKILVAFLSVHAILYNNYLQRPPYNYATGTRVSGGSMFDSVIALRNAMLKGDQEAIGSRVLGSLDAGLGNLVTRIAENGSSYERASLNVTRNSQTALNVTQMIATEGDLDFTKAVTDMKMMDYVHQASLSVAGKMYSSTLLNYMR